MKNGDELNGKIMRWFIKLAALPYSGRHARIARLNVNVNVNVNRTTLAGWGLINPQEPLSRRATKIAR